MVDGGGGRGSSVVSMEEVPENSGQRGGSLAFAVALVPFPCSIPCHPPHLKVRQIMPVARTAATTCSCLCSQASLAEMEGGKQRSLPEQSSCPVHTLVTLGTLCHSHKATHLT